MNALVEGVLRFAARDVLDEDGRPCGELASVRYDPARTDVVACPYRGVRHGRPMNRTALAQATSVWPEVLAAARGLAGPSPTVHQAFRAALAGTVAPLVAGEPVPRARSALFKTCLGFSQVLSTLLLGDDGVADAPLAELGDTEAFLAFLDDGRWLVGQEQVCAGTDAMIGRMFAALSGRDPGPAAPAPELLAAADVAVVVVGVQAAALGVLYQARRRGEVVPIDDVLARPPGPWLRGVTARPDARPEHARRLFPGGRAPDTVERVVSCPAADLGETVRSVLATRVTR